MQELKTQETLTVEEQLGKMGAKIDHLILKANEAKKELSAKIKTLKQEGGEALDEIKKGLDNAVEDVNVAWDDIMTASKRAAKKFQKCESDCKHS